MKKISQKALLAIAEREITLRDITVGQVLTLRVCTPPPSSFYWVLTLSDEAFYWYEDVVVGAVLQHTKPEQYEELLRRLPEQVPVPPGYFALDAEGRKRFMAVTTPERPTIYLHPTENGALGLLGAWFFGLDHDRRRCALSQLKHLAQSIDAEPLDVPW